MQWNSKNFVMLAGGLGVIGLAIVLFVVRESPEAKYPTKVYGKGVCLETKAEIDYVREQGQYPPFVNPATGRRTVYPWWYCPACNKRFVPALIPARDGGPPRMQQPPSCPLCGSGSVGGWYPADPDQASPAGDAPLPEMPK